ncbi:putative pyridoxal phosphate-dependent transferase [Rosa chinensis]|uniref:Putative pyridoxal phosphate-dependent transferase n=1 Tax=Rosa chinensis TaxID=74649 RepID=A0A2P6RT18_ROSCH|nr:putative pyridoxal phosphate-dependent transferase [Rosa chinensis]
MVIGQCTYKKASGRRIRLAMIDHVTSMPSVVLPVRKLMVGCVDVDMQEIGADFYTSNLHKWFFCPASVAFLYCRKSVTHLELHHPMVSHDCVVEFTNRFEGGIEGIKRRNHDAVVVMGKMLAKAWGTNLGSPPDMCASMIMVGISACLEVSSDDDALKLRTHILPYAKT